MDRFFENTFPDHQSSTPPIIRESHLENHNIEESASQLLKLLESKLRKDGEVDWNDATVYTGSAGYSLLYYFLFKKLGLERYLSESRRYAGLASQKGRSGRVTFLCGDVGPLAVSALANGASNDVPAATECVRQVLSFLPVVLDQKGRLPDELLFGRAGFLYTLNLLRHEIPAACGSITDSVIRQVLSAIIESGRRTAATSGSGSPLFYYWHDSAYIGAAHGLCGIIYQLLLNARLLSREELETLIRPTLDFLLSLRFPSGNIRSSCGKDADRLVHWCHGAPGFVFTLTEGYRVFGDEKYLDAALLSGDVIWTRGLLRKGYGLCHGVSGNAYAFLNLFRATSDIRHLHRAVSFAEFCAAYGSHGCRTPDSPWSLFEGLAGTVYFMFDIQKPLQAHFPAYELKQS